MFCFQYRSNSENECYKKTKVVTKGAKTKKPAEAQNLRTGLEPGCDEYSKEGNLVKMEITKVATGFTRNLNKLLNQIFYDV